MSAPSTSRAAAHAGKNAYYVVPVRTIAALPPADVDGSQRCQYFTTDWVRMQGAPMDSYKEIEVVLIQPSAALAAPHVTSPDEPDPEAVMYAGVAKTLQRNTDMPKTFLAVREGPDSTPVIRVPVHSATKRGVIIIFAKPVDGEGALKLAATTDPEITNSTNL